MKQIILWVSAALLSMAATVLPERELSKTEEPASVDHFETAIEIIKKYEGLHSPRHWPLVGYGHKVLPGEKFPRGRTLTEKEAEDLLRKDFRKFCKLFRSYGRDSILMAALAYNIGNGAAERSTVAKKLKSGDRNIRENYLSHSRYRGKTLPQLRRRRAEEFEKLFVTEELGIRE
ncbi:MAG: glycoside hydrolase family protein [Clostridium sp.]|nr:glycoside hydrolase family protein [Prevotella sp.]MCM1429162.1 glycoside hydrolase family protein [Clostridium sp.]MCM1475310.1 glycoside hydrolase family protein [Muribaculaceae bacterium]